MLNKEICKKCQHSHEQYCELVCMRYAYRHSEFPIDDDINEEERILNECPYKLEHIVSTQGELNG